MSRRACSSVTCLAGTTSSALTRCQPDGAAHRLGHLARLEREGGRGERLVEEPLGDEAELAAAGLRVLVLGERRGDLGEVLALLHARRRLLDLLLRGRGRRRPARRARARGARGPCASVRTGRGSPRRTAAPAPRRRRRAPSPRRRWAASPRPSRRRAGTRRRRARRGRPSVSPGAAHLGLRDLHRLRGRPSSSSGRGGRPSWRASNLAGEPYMARALSSYERVPELAVLLERRDRRAPRGSSSSLGDRDAALLRLLHHQLAVDDLLHRLRGEAELVGELAGERVPRLPPEELVELAVLPLPLGGRAWSCRSPCAA